MKSFSRQNKQRELTTLGVAVCAVMVIAWLLIASGDTPSRRSSSATGPSVSEAAKPAIPFFGAGDRKCTQAEREMQAEVLPAIRVRGCSAKDFAAIRLVRLHMPNARNFIDIGANKGYAAAELFEIFAPEQGITRKRLKAVYSSPNFPADLKGDRAFAAECGGCNECRDEVEPLLATHMYRACTDQATITTSGRNAGKLLTNAADKLCSLLSKNRANQPVRVWSFEGNPDLVHTLRTAMSELEKTLSDVQLRPRDISEARFPKRVPLSRTWLLENAIITSSEHQGKSLKITLREGELGRVELVPFPISPPDDERSATFWVKPRADAQTAAVMSTTIDAILERLERQEGLHTVDMVKVDVEGHDFAVIKGAKNALKLHKIKVLKFEYGQLWTESLKDAIELLDDIDYACYFEGKNGFAKLTGRCWSDSLETHFWSNVWCFSTKHSDSLGASLAFDAMTVAFW